MKYPDELIRFARFLSENEEAQSQIKSAQNPSEIVGIAVCNGFNISIDELRVASRELSASYWTWAGRSREWRRDFFDHKSIVDNM
jgi:hypothetical protein